MRKGGAQLHIYPAELHNSTTLRNGKLNLIILNPQNLDDYAGIAMRFGSWFLGNAETDTLPYRIFEVNDVEIVALEEMPCAPMFADQLPTIIKPDDEPIEGVPVGKRDQPTTMLDGDVFGHTPVVVATLPKAVDVYVPMDTVA